MINFYRKFIFLILISIAVGMSAQPSGAADDEDRDIGLGGTGLLANTSGGLGGTGIIGEITGFGSIFVNGIEIEYDDKTAFTINGEAAEHQPLTIGDVVEVLTIDNNNYTHAQTINLRHELIGKVDSIDAQTYSFTINGQTVIQAIDKNIMPEIGKTVAVSGFRVDPHTILSTKVSVTDNNKTFIRSNAELPYQGQTERWRIQSHVRDGNTSIQLDGKTYNLKIQKAVADVLKSRSQIRIMEIKKSSSGKIELNQVFNINKLPRGRSTLDTNQLPGNSSPRIQSPGTSSGKTPGAAAGQQSGKLPGALPGMTQGVTNKVQTPTFRK